MPDSPCSLGNSNSYKMDLSPQTLGFQVFMMCLFLHGTKTQASCKNGIFRSSEQHNPVPYSKNKMIRMAMPTALIESQIMT